MKIVREHINEKFSEESDPVHDLGIGIIHAIEKFCDKHRKVIMPTYECDEKDIMLLICVDRKKHDYVEDLLKLGANVHTSAGIHLGNEDLPVRYAIWNNDYEMTELLLKYGASIENAFDEDVLELIETGDYMGGKKSKELIDLVKQHLEKPVNEKFSEESDPIYDLGIGIITKLRKFLKDHHCDNFDLRYKPDQDKALSLCVKTNTPDFIQYLVSLGADPNFSPEDKDFGLYLMNAAYVEDWEVCKALVNSGADLDKTITCSIDRQTPITLKNLERFKEMIENPINEKFSEKSDPIKDMGIGLYTIRNFENLNEIAEFIISIMPYILKTHKIPEDIIHSEAFILKQKYIKPLDNYIYKYIRLNNEEITSAIDYKLFENMLSILAKRGFKYPKTKFIH